MPVPSPLRRCAPVLAWVALAGPSQVLAMKPAIPAVSHHTSDDGTVTLDIPDKRTGKVPELRVKGRPAQAFRWPAPMLPPSEVVLVPTHRTVVLLGGLGDPGVSLGRVELRTFEGDTRAVLDLRTHVPGLEELARDYREKAGNFPWIGETRVQGDALEIQVVGRIPVRVDLRTHAVTVIGPTGP